MNNVSGHIAILAGAGVAAGLLSLAIYLGQRTETAASAQAPVVVTLPPRLSEPAGRPSPQQPPTGVAAPRDPASLARQLQSELKRVGCYDGEIGGVWTPRARMAMKAFTDRVNASLPVDKPDHILLALVQNHRGLACGPPCPTGDDGRCVPKPILAKAGKKPEPPEADAAEKPLPAMVPPIAAVAPKVLSPPNTVTPAAPKAEHSPQVPAPRADPAPAPAQAQTPPGEPRRTLRHGGPVPVVGIYERRLRRSLRPSRQVRYARSLIRSLQRAAMTPWRLP